jgi:hypothetical protein
MAVVVFILFVAALICFALSAANVPTSPRLNILGLGLFFLTLAIALPSLKGV